jgi:IS30 family transposase
MGYIHLTTYERGKIEAYRLEGKTTREIGAILGRHHSTIARELKRHTNNTPGTTYNAETADMQYRISKSRCGAKSKWTESKALHISDRLKKTGSPEQIAGREGKELNISCSTIYRWLYDGLLPDVNPNNLRHKGKRRRPVETRGKFNVGTSIRKRPKEVRKRKSFGHWEADTMVSSRGKSKGCLATFAERKSRLYLTFKMPNRSSKLMTKAIKHAYSLFPKETFKTITSDRGKEFSCYSEIESSLDVGFYFADPYSTWQRGTNENSNGLLREFYPEKTDFAKVATEDLITSLQLINNRPRKCLGWKTPLEVFVEEVSHVT